MPAILAIAIIVIVAVSLLLFLIFRNKKDRRELEETLNQDTEKPKTHLEDEDLG